MSEYIEIRPEFSDDPDVVVIYTNLTLTEREAEQYDSVMAMEEGSPLAQMLAVIDGIERLHLQGDKITIWRDPAEDWHFIVADVTAALKDFFL